MKPMSAEDVLADLLDVNEHDVEDCRACIAADDLPGWPYGSCPFHHGVAVGLRLAGADE